jgi:SAM-dependent methyltransferase
VAEQTTALRPQSVLDVGCGDGFLLGLLGPAIPRRKGIDASERAVLLARAMHPDVEFAVGDLASLDEVFDVVLAIEILEHVPDVEVAGVLRHTARLLRPGGSLLVSVPTTNMQLTPKHHRHYDRALLERQVESSGAPLALASVEYVYRKSLLVDFWTALTNNRYWIVELYPLTRLVWRYVWSRLRHAAASDGAHLFARFDRRPDDA